MGNICRTASYQKSNPCTEKIIKKLTILYFSDAQCRNSRATNLKLSMEPYLESRHKIYAMKKQVSILNIILYTPFFLLSSLIILS